MQFGFFSFLHSSILFLFRPARCKHKARPRQAVKRIILHNYFYLFYCSPLRRPPRRRFPRRRRPRPKVLLPQRLISYNALMPFYKDKTFQLLFVLLALCKTAVLLYVMLAHPLGQAVLVFPDSITYVYPAQTWLQYGAMWEAVSAAPLLLRTPGYPFFLALIGFFTGNLTWAVAIAQNILSLFLLIPVYLTANWLAGRAAARWAAFFCAASVLYFSLSFAVLSETLCVFLLAWFVFFTVRFLKQPRTADVAAAAVFLAASVYVRPAVYYFMLAAAVILVCFQAGKLVRFPLHKIIVFFILPLLLLTGAWQLRNRLQTGFGGFSSVGAYNLYMWNQDYLAHKFALSVPQAHEALERALPADFSQRPAREQVQIYKALARPLIQESFFYKLSRAPLWALKTLFGANFVHLSRLLWGGRTPQEALEGEMLNHTEAVHTRWLENFSDKLLFAGAAGQVMLTVLLAIMGFGLLWKKDKAITFFLGVYCLYFWAIGSSFFGAYARFRAPFEFVLCIAAGAAAAALWQRVKTHGKRRL